MSIASIWNTLRGAAAEPRGPVEKPAEPPPSDLSTAQAPAISPQSRAALSRVLERYDVTSISPRDFAQLIQELKQTGGITPAERDELALIRLELDEQGVGPDEPLNLVEFFQKKLSRQERELSKLEEKQGLRLDRGEALQSTLRQIDWLQKFALLHHSPAGGSLDVAA